MPAELATTLTPSADDRLLQAEALVRSYCRWHIAPSRTGVVYTSTYPTTAIVLPSLRVTAIESVVDAAGNPYATTDYSFTQAGVLKRGFYDDFWCFHWVREWWPRGTVVTFTHGYDEPPADVTAVVQSVAQRATDNPGGAIRQVGQVAYATNSSGSTLAGFLTDADKDQLAPYRIPSRP